MRGPQNFSQRLACLVECKKTKRTSSADFLFFNRLERGVGTLGCHDHMAGMGNFVLGNLADLISQQRDDGESFAGKGHEFNRATFAAFVNEHDRADVILGQAMLRQVGRQYHAVEFFDHNQISNGYAVANVAVSAFLAIYQTTRTSGE